MPVIIGLLIASFTFGIMHRKPKCYVRNVEFYWTDGMNDVWQLKICPSKN